MCMEIEVNHLQIGEGKFKITLNVNIQDWLSRTLEKQRTQERKLIKGIRAIRVLHGMNTSSKKQKRMYLRTVYGKVMTKNIRDKIQLEMPVVPEESE